MAGELQAVVSVASSHLVGRSAAVATPVVVQLADVVFVLAEVVVGMAVDSSAQSLRALDLNPASWSIEQVVEQPVGEALAF